MNSNNFTQFCQNFYQNDAASQAIHQFEQRAAWYSSLALLVLWHIKTHQGRLTQSQLSNLQASIQDWHERIVTPMLHLHHLVSNENEQSLSAETKELLTFSLSYEIELLEKNLPATTPNRRHGKLLIADACQNILVYCKLINLQLDEEDSAALKTLLCCVFDQQESRDIHCACEQHISAHYLKQPLTFEQLLLEEL